VQSAQCWSGHFALCILHFSFELGRPGAAPGKLSFGDSAAQAGARLVFDLNVRNADEVRIESPFRKQIGAAAGDRTRTCSLARSHSPVKSQPRKLKGRERSCSQPMPFQQRTNTSCYLAIPTHGFTVVLSVFRGTPPAKPLDCKIRPNSSGALSTDQRADPTGGEPRLSRPSSVAMPQRTSASVRSSSLGGRSPSTQVLRRVDAFLCFVPGDIIKTSVSLSSQCLPFVIEFCFFSVVCGQ